MDIAGAEKKLRQAKFFLWYLDEAPTKYRHEVGNTEPIEFYYSACLSAAQSVFYVLHDSGGAVFKDAESRWRNDLKDNAERAKFWSMVSRRDDDVHRATSDAHPLPKYVPDDWHRHPSTWQHPAYRLMRFGGHPTEEKNPDGTTATGYELRGTISLYIRREGREVEVTTACREFIEQLRSLVEAMKTVQEGCP